MPSYSYLQNISWIHPLSSPFPDPTSLSHVSPQLDYYKLPTVQLPPCFPAGPPPSTFHEDLLRSHYGRCSRLFKWNGIQGPWYDPRSPVWPCYPPWLLSRSTCPAQSTAATLAALCVHKCMTLFPSSGPPHWPFLMFLNFTQLFLHMSAHISIHMEAFSGF